MAEASEILQRLEKLEAQMVFLFRQLGIETPNKPTWNASSRILDLVRKGDTLGAIKAFREETGAGLKDAKDYIEALQKR